MSGEQDDASAKVIVAAALGHDPFPGVVSSPNRTLASFLEYPPSIRGKRDGSMFDVETKSGRLANKQR